MQKIHQNILVVIFSLFTIPVTAYIFGLFWDYFNLGKFTSENIFLQKSNCDPAEAELTILGNVIVMLIVFAIGIIISNYIVKFLYKNKNIKMVYLKKDIFVL